MVKLAGAFVMATSLFALPDVLASGAAVSATALAPAPAVSVASPSVTRSRAPSAAPIVNTATPLVLVASAPAHAGAVPATTGAAGKTSTVTKPAKARPVTRAAAPVAIAALTVVVNTSGGQSAIDRCTGAVLYGGSLIAQHDYCGGTRFYPLKVGSLVTLTGGAVLPGAYRVVSVGQGTVGSANYATPHPYALVTCLSGGAVKLWYLQPA